jgi:hypothetical protein
MIFTFSRTACILFVALRMKNVMDSRYYIHLGIRVDEKEIILSEL